MAIDCLKFRKGGQRTSKNKKEEEKAKSEEIKIEVSQSVRVRNNPVIKSAPRANEGRRKFEAPIIERPPLFFRINPPNDMPIYAPPTISTRSNRPRISQSMANSEYILRENAHLQ
jgi:hypothetical protein